MEYEYEQEVCSLKFAEWLEDLESASGVEFPLAAHHFSRTASRCACGVIESFLPQFLRFVVFAALQRLIYSFDVERRPLLAAVADFLVGALGILLSWYNRESLEAAATLFVYFVVSTTAIFAVGSTNSRTLTGHVCLALTFVYTTFCQMYVFDALTFTSLYGSLMVAAMKQISLAYDWRRERATPALAFEVFAYLFNPATLSFGPFLGFTEFVAGRQRSRQLFGGKWPNIVQTILNQLLLVGRLFLIAFVFFIASHCFSEQLPYLIFGPDSTFLNIFPLFPDRAVRFAMGYAEAQSFRFNHYFVCYLADGLCAVGGLRYAARVLATEPPRRKETESEDEKILRRAGRTSTMWPAVEWPRSMSTVVVAWNLPMHDFLRRYIYETTRESLGYLLSIFLTFTVSAFLHGFNFQLSAVLISLAVYAVVESDCRYRMSERFNACVKSRPCRQNCEHRFRRFGVLATVINLLFIAINIYHLAYLGAPFAASATEASEAGYNWRHTLAVWSHWKFASPLIAFAMLLISRLF